MQKAQQEMTSVKAALLSFAMLSAIVLCGLGTYAGDAAANHNAVDGYGVTAALRSGVSPRSLPLGLIRGCAAVLG
jgi:hypothetical protein